MFKKSAIIIALAGVVVGATVALIYGKAAPPAELTGKDPRFDACWKVGQTAGITADSMDGNYSADVSKFYDTLAEVGILTADEAKGSMIVDQSRYMVMDAEGVPQDVIRDHLVSSTELDCIKVKFRTPK